MAQMISSGYFSKRALKILSSVPLGAHLPKKALVSAQAFKNLIRSCSVVALLLSRRSKRVPMSSAARPLELFPRYLMILPGVVKVLLILSVSISFASFHGFCRAYESRVDSCHYGIYCQKCQEILGKVAR